MKNPSPPPLFKKSPETLPDMLRYLNLPTSAETYADVIAQAGKDNLSHEEFLKRFLSNEASAKFERQVKSRLATARFPTIKTLDTFDWNHPVSIPKAKILEAMELRFLEKSEGLVTAWAKPIWQQRWDTERPSPG